jgi:hypothetical protein
VIHLPGKSAGEIGLYFDPAYHAISREMGGILLLGDAIIGNTWLGELLILFCPGGSSRG